jgi:hypothetical protein
MEKEEKYWEVRHGRHMKQGQDRKLNWNLPLIGEVLHCSTLTMPKKMRAQKKTDRHRGQKRVLRGVPPIM